MDDLGTANPRRKVPVALDGYWTGTARIAVATCSKTCVWNASSICWQQLSNSTTTRARPDVMYVTSTKYVYGLPLKVKCAVVRYVVDGRDNWRGRTSVDASLTSPGTDSFPT